MDKSVLACGLALVLLGLGLASCDVPAVDPTALASATQPATQTATPVWFPLTATPTLLPTLPRTPTPDLRPEIGEIILADGLSVEQAWYTFPGSIGNITFSEDHLTLAVNQPPGMIYAIRETPILTDFYSEITADINFCQTGDEYGLMVRVDNDRLDHFRFAISCDGQAKIVQVHGSSGVVLEPLLKDPVIPIGFPGQTRLAVWASGEEIRFFVNGKYLFSIVDRIIGQGALGVYVRTTGEDPISINFSQQVIHELLP
ncbi:MAG: hypothetical protein ABFS17_04005 [Chloroflexota bacterium]